jgi:histone deacetylase 1/2
LDLQQGGGSNSSANLASRGGRSGGGNPHGRGSGGRGGRGRGRSRGNGRQGPQNGSKTKRPTCQLCGREGHTIIRFYKHFDASFQGVQEHKSASTATTSYNVDTNWYTDTGATDHVTSELEKLTMRDKYQAGDQVHTASGVGMEIEQIGRSFVRTLHRDLVLSNVLYVPQANKNLASVHKLPADNDAFYEFHPNYFLIKDRTTKKVLLRGRCEGGLYPLRSTSSSNKRTLAATSLSSSRWHNRLVYPSSAVVQQILSHFKLPFVPELNNDSICDACQKGKSHQLPYPTSTSVSSKPLELVLSDVWGPAPTSVGKNQFYVSFIDDYSKFTWIYLLHHKSEVFQRFQDFQNLVERLFDRNILPFRLIGVVSIKN